MSKDQLVGIKIDFHASSYNLGSFSNSALKNDVQYYIPTTYRPDRESTNSNSGKGNYIESTEEFRISSDLSRNAQLLIANNFQIETTIEFTSDGLHYLYSDNTTSDVTHLNIQASTTSKNLEIFYGTTLCLSFNYNFAINTKYNIVITYINSRYYLMVNGVECGKSTIEAAENLNSLFQDVTIYQCFYSYKYNANLANGFIGNIYDLIYSFDNKYVHRSINGYSLVNNHLLSNLSFSNTLDIERKNEPSITWDYENVNFGADKIIFDITPMSANIPSKDFKVEFTINDIELGIHNIAKIDNRYYIDYTVTGASPGSSYGSSYDIALYDSITNESSNIIVDTINDKNILKRIGNEISYSSGSNVINLNAEEKTEETTDIVLFDTFKGSIENDIKVYDGDYNDAEFVNNPITYDYVDIEIAEDEYCESRSFELGDYIIKGFIEGYRNHDYQIIQTNNNFVVAYGNDDFYYDGIEKRFLNDYSVLDVQTGILHKIFDRVMVKGSLQINVVSLLCDGSDYAIRLYRKTDNFFLGDYAIINGMCLIENLDCNTLYDCIIYDRSGIYEGRTLSSRVPTPL